MAWGYGYGSRSYATPTPMGMDDADVEELVKQLKTSIDGDKLKDIKSILAKLKLAVNDNFLLYTRDVAYFGAYVYAINNKKKKSADSILSVLLKKNFTYDGFPLDVLLKELSPTDFKIIMSDIMAVNDQWRLEGLDTIELMMDKYPAETEKFIISGKLNMYEKGENRTLTTKLVISKGSAEAGIAALNTFFGKDYIEKYGINAGKLNDLLSVIDTKPLDVRKRIRSEFFYKVAVKSISIEMLEKDNIDGLLDDAGLKNYTNTMFSTYRSTLIQNLQYMKNDELRVKIIGSNEELLNFITKTYPNMLPKEIQDIFLF